MLARSALRYMRSTMGGLDRNKIPRPPLWQPKDRLEVIAHSARLTYKLDMWKAWIEWEKSNPLLLESDEAIYTRVIYAYKQAVMNMRFYPEIWCHSHILFHLILQVFRRRVREE
jgi:cleavage stimulation factor subunit 3